MDEEHTAAQGSQSFRRTPGIAGDVTVVLTSCGRQDLLERTLDSFFLRNTYPIHDFIIIEDGDGSINDRLRSKYQNCAVTWLDTGERAGQVAAIDIAYAHVKTDFIFHCEDDWVFLRPRFIERSIVILNSRPDILMVSLRDKDDQNGHPVYDRVYFAEWVPYRLMQESYDAGEWGTWHGFAWNPGLRRRRDYELLGSFGSLDPLHTKPAWQVEREAGAFYRKHGFAIALLAEDCGPGYVRHLGDDRHVIEVTGKHSELPTAVEQAGVASAETCGESAALLPDTCAVAQTTPRVLSYEEEEAGLRAAFLEDIRGLHPDLPVESVEYCVNISLMHKYVYVAAPKCACSTVLLTLQRMELGDPTFQRGDFEDLHLRGFSPLLDPKQVGSFRKILGDGTYLRFCFVRHPYTRLLSAYLDKIIRDQGAGKAHILHTLEKPETDLTVDVSFEEFVDVVCAEPISAMDDHWRVQYYQTMQAGIDYDFIGKFENFEQDFLAIGSRISPNFCSYFGSERRHATGADLLLEKYLSERVKGKIFEKYRIDFEHFGYDP